ncbi:MAG: hypothetical protein LAT58_02890 [Opitutales bacterium]|nr:hypothetical protein [Opitutales bacterium]
MKSLDTYFPRYEEYDPKVPVWCVTPDLSGCFHRFFDTSPISPSGRYLAVFRLPFEDRPPEPGEAGEVVVVDLQEGTHRAVAETIGWEPQLGANLNWGGSDNELFFNDVDASTWQPFAWKLNPISGEKMKMEGTVYHASPDGRWLISANMGSMRRTQAGYGVVLPYEKVRRNVGSASDDGFFLTDTHTGHSRLLISIADLLREANPPVRIEDAENQEIYAFHSKFNTSGDSLMLSLRWFPASCPPRWNMLLNEDPEVCYAWVTMGVDGSEIHCAVGQDQWRKGGHHGTWFPDGKRISMNLNIDEENMRFVQVNEDGTGLQKMLNHALGSGHPTVHRDGKHLLTDTYTIEKASYNDGTIPLRWIDLESGDEQVVVRINTAQPCADSTMRVDPHPAWDRSWRYVTFNAFVGGTRKVFIADWKNLFA